MTGFSGDSSDDGSNEALRAFRPDAMLASVLPPKNPPLDPQFELPSDDKPLKSRHELLAYMRASGVSNAEIAAVLGIKPDTVSIVANYPRIKERVAAIQAQYWGGNIQMRFQKAIPAAMSLMEAAVEGSIPGIKSGDRLHAAQWILEKVTGKPRQEVDLDGGNSILQLLQALDAMKKASSEQKTLTEQEQKIIDVTPPADPFSDFVSQQKALSQKEGS